jgi:hypothetical protein
LSDPTNPDHYRWHPLGIECIDVTEHFPSNIAHAIEYLWRCGRKDDAAQDLRKAIWYIEREINRLGGPTNEALPCRPDGGPSRQ